MREVTSANTGIVVLFAQKYVGDTQERGGDGLFRLQSVVKAGENKGVRHHVSNSQLDLLYSPARLGLVNPEISVIEVWLPWDW